MAIEVLVATEEQRTIDAVRAAFRQQFPGLDIHARGITGVDSSVDAQPVGKRTRRGAKNLLRNAKKAFQREINAADSWGDPIPPTPDYYVSTIDGIFPDGKGKERRWFDRSIVIVQQHQGRRRFAMSEGLEVPAVTVDEARKMGFETTKVRSLLADTFGGDAYDPFQSLTYGRTSQTQIVASLTMQALNKFNPDPFK